MWIVVYNCQNGVRITDATFTCSWYNDGGGWYYMYIGYGENFCVRAPGYVTVCGNTDSYSSMYASLCPSPPPPPPSCGCWS
jgi:hypothetical protein